MTIAAPATSAAGPLARRGVIHTTKGDIHIELYPEHVPKTVENFVGLSKKHYYDDVIFHRVIPKFVSHDLAPASCDRRVDRAVVSLCTDAPNRRSSRRRHRGRVPVGVHVRRRVPPAAQARPALHAQHGQRWTQDERESILYHDCAVPLVSFVSWPMSLAL